MEIEKIGEQPTEIRVVFIEAVLMPNGEVISVGQAVGWFNKLKEYIYIKK